MRKRLARWRVRFEHKTGIVWGTFLATYAEDYLFAFRFGSIDSKLVRVEVSVLGHGAYLDWGVKFL